jgi:drug/metabolite transporter (DMT)-like permease
MRRCSTEFLYSSSSSPPPSPSPPPPPSRSSFVDALLLLFRRRRGFLWLRERIRWRWTALGAIFFPFGGRQQAMQ